MRYIAIVMFISSCCILGLSCKRKNVNQFTISSNIDTSELKYEKVFPLAFENYLDSEVGYHGKKHGITDDEKNNFSTIYFYQNDTLVKNNTLFGDNKFLSAFCNGLFKDDTLVINIKRAFFEAGDMGVVIKISGNYYEGYYFENEDSSGDLKYKRIYPLKQTLILDKNPAFEHGKILTGQYEGSFRIPSNNQDTDEVKIKVVFKCVERALLRL